MSSEEKLLGLIKDQKNSEKNTRRLNKKSKIKISSDFLTTVNRLLIIMSIGIVVFFALRLWNNGQNTNDIILDSFVIAGEGSHSSQDVTFSEIKPFNYYKKRIEERDIFELPWEKIKSSKIERFDSKIPELGRHIKVIGIVLDQDPKVIIENLKTRETLFLSKGERYGDMILQEIYEDKAVFLYNNEQIELAP